jgi:hypothetical protein
MTKRRTEKLASKNLDELLVAVFTVCMLDGTLHEQTLDRTISSAKQSARRKIAAIKPNREVTLDNDTLGFVIYRWQRLPKYLDQHGDPLALPARGSGKSIQGLFREVRRSSYFEDGFKHLLRTRRILKTSKGRYAPNGETTLIYALTPEIVEHLTHTINRLVSTVLYNTSVKSSRSGRLIERMAAVTDLPKAKVPAFKKFALEQGAVFINTLNDWLESRRDGSDARVLNSSKHLTAGVHLFGFLSK